MPDPYHELETLTMTTVTVPLSPAQFLGRSQTAAIRQALRGEERKWFRDKMEEINRTISTMPKTYEQDGKGEQAVAHLHYFTSGCDWYITERDQEHEQHQAFGLANLGDGGELGYISIVELLEAGAELDLHWQPKTLAEIRKPREPLHYCEGGAGFILYRGRQAIWETVSRFDMTNYLRAQNLEADYRPLRIVKLV